MVNTEKEKTMSELMTKLLERLAEMFPDSGYQSKLEAYIASRHPCDVFDVERFEKEFSKEFKGFL
jgi:exonuclease V gamma subunit